MSHHKKEMHQEVRSEHWLNVKNDQDYFHLIEKKPGLFVRHTGCCIYEYLCVATKVPLEEISFCTCAAPDANLDRLVTTPHSEIIPCPDKFPMIIEAMKHIWVTVNNPISVSLNWSRFMRKSLRQQKKIRSPPFIHWMNSNCGRIIIFFQAIWISNPPTRRSWTCCVSCRNVLLVWLICWAGSSTWTESLAKLEEQNCWTISTPWDSSQGSSRWTRCLFWLALQLSILP